MSKKYITGTWNVLSINEQKEFMESLKEGMEEEQLNSFANEEEFEIYASELFDEFAKEDLKDYINEYENKSINASYSIDGSLGLWNGRREIHSYDDFDSLEDAIKECLENSWDYELFEIRGKLYINSFHHDGRNTFVIMKRKNNYLVNVNLLKTIGRI